MRQKNLSITEVVFLQGPADQNDAQNQNLTKATPGRGRAITAFYLSLFFLPATLFAQDAIRWRGISIHGLPKYQQGFHHLRYANPNAPQGGQLTIGRTGSFDTLNGYSAKGIPPILISGLVFQTLGQSTHDEPFSVYPELAKSFEVSEDQMSMTVRLNPAAKFSDGKNVTFEDVRFSFELFRSDAVNAFYKSYWADIAAIEKISPEEFRFIFSKKNTELPAIALQLTIFPSHVYKKGNFGKDFSEVALGSGPYLVRGYKRGAYITYQKNPDFWARNSPFYKGRFNFDKITIKYYRDDTARLEAFKKGDFDLYICHSSQVWANGLTGKKFTPANWILKEQWPHKNNAGAQGFFFNLQKKIFHNIRVREAIAMAFDFDWTNRTLFYDQYQKNLSFFENSGLKATGKPSPEEREILGQLSKKFPSQVPESALTEPMGGHYKKLPFKKRLRLARKILKSEGYEVRNGVLTSTRDKHTLSFRFLLSSPAMARAVEPFIANLRKIGIRVSIDMEEPSVYQRKLQGRNFDMVVLRIGQSQSPGNEQIDFWHSSQADEKYSRNYYGLKNKAVDEAIERIIRAKTRQELVLNTKILDRLLYHLHITVHNWHNKSHRVAMWNKFGKPENFPDYYLPLTFIDFLWLDQSKSRDLKNAINNQKHLPR